MKYLFTIFFAALLINSYSQNILIGKWRRTDASFKQIKKDSSQAQMGDLTLYPDSTFFIQGEPPKAGPTVPGWHVGDEFNGFWQQPDKNHLLLQQQNTLYLYFFIVALTDEKLVLILEYDRKNDKRFYWHYKRI